MNTAVLPQLVEFIQVQLKADKLLQECKRLAVYCSRKSPLSLCFQGLEKVEVESANAGEIVAIAGLEGIAIGETLGRS